MGDKKSFQLPKHIYIHWFLIIAIFTMLITALLTFVLVTAPIEHQQKTIIETVNYLINECKFIPGTQNYGILQNITFNFSK